MSSIEEKLYTVRFKADEKSHLKVIDPEKCKKCKRKQCTYTCPAECYKLEGEVAQVSFEGCLECGTCRIICTEFNNIEWNYPRGGFGVAYKFG